MIANFPDVVLRLRLSPISRCLLGLLMAGLAPAYANIPVVTTNVAPIQIIQTTSGGNRTYFIDFGSAYFGSVSFRLTNSGASQSGQIVISEAASKTDVITTAIGARSSTATLTVAAGARDYSQFTDQPIKACRIRVPEAGVTLDSSSIVLKAKHVAFVDSASQFTSSDSSLNRVYQFCKHTVKATSFLGVYLDGIRETKPYEGDAYINMLSHFAAEANPPIALFTHEYLLTHSTWPWEYRLMSILIGWEIYMATGDKDQLQRNYATMTQRIQDGIGSGSWSDSTALVDWPTNMRDDFVFTRGNGVTNAWVYKSFMTIADMADALGKTSEATAYRNRGLQTQKRFHDSLWVKGQNRYRDGLATTHVSLHGNLYPLALGLVPDSLQPALSQYLASRGMVCNVYAAQFLLDGLFDAGNDSAAIALMAAKTGNSWLHMLDQVGSSLTMEVWDPSQKPNLDWNHAWATAPANVIPRKLFGIMPLTPGYGKVQIKPQVGALASGSYTQPTVKGAVKVAFESRKGQWMRLTVEIPPSATAKVYVPVMGLANSEVYVDNQKRNGVREGNFLAVDSIAAGTHRIERNPAITSLKRNPAAPSLARVRIQGGFGSVRIQRNLSEWESPSTANLTLFITDIRGKAVKRWILSGAPEQTMTLNPGIYVATWKYPGQIATQVTFSVD